MKRVEAVKTIEEVKVIEKLLRENGTDMAADIWSIGINMALRITDLLSIRYDQVTKDSFEIKEGKTGKYRKVVVNASARAIINKRHKQFPKQKYIFQATAHNVYVAQPVSRQYISKQFKAVGDVLGIRFNTHSMRKTRGRVMYESGCSLALVAKVLNHSSEAETLRYIGIEQDDIDKTYTDFCL